MPNKKPWDVESTHSLRAFAEFARKKAGASVVLIVRDRDYAFAPHPDIRPKDAKTAIEFVLETAAADLEAQLKAEQEEATRKRAAQIAAKAARVAKGA